MMLLRTLTCASLISLMLGTTEEGERWLAEKEKEDGVIKLPSGLMFKVLEAGDGDFHPKASTLCKVHYEGTFTNGTKWDSSYDRGQPNNFAPDWDHSVVPAWTEAMQLMVEGDKWELYVPSDLAYGDDGIAPTIPGGAALVYQIELLNILGIEDELTPANRCHPARLAKCNDRQKNFIEKQQAKGADKISAELKRLKGMLVNEMTEEKALEWIYYRIRILHQLTGLEPRDEL
eukprot:gnl/MRDRNA2_/MRDRNA2_31143_c0_seq2.p1 gnl/MRDRNA2_/MRDRNA2_31143_c0~~gnl/MRDRNA2_/MRDRNA2_31143_c0_seq2.p1  ORF type:complete len:232 (+),score=48.96 gnl/MRDRNA2_/MRDRNA2_31143_c0_seq2:99-794(+)